MIDNNINELENFALKCREDIIKMSARGGCFIGASLSCVDLIVYLYKKLFILKDIKLKSNNRDYFILSKGHDVPAWYSVLANLGIIELKRLENHCSINDNIYWHPNISMPGVEFHSGSLGHGISIAMGMAYYHKINKMNNKIVVMLGDGELNEGSVWEGFLVASAKNLNNLVAIIDRNEFQANLKTEDLIPLEPIEDKIKSFGWDVQRINGHKYDEIDRAFSNISNSNNPSAIIADTVRGKGLPSIERDPSRWFVHFTDDEVIQLINELHGKKAATLESKKLFVR